jgi:hypothetical protein
MEENSAFSLGSSGVGEPGVAPLDVKATQQGAAVTENPSSSNVTPMPGLSQAWDPYDVWLNRVRKPREQSAAGVRRAFVLNAPPEREAATHAPRHRH